MAFKKKEDMPEDTAGAVEIEIEASSPPEGEEEVEEESVVEEEGPGGEEEIEESEEEVEDKLSFASPTEALGAAIEEHGPDPVKLVEWLEQYGYSISGGEDLGGLDALMDPMGGVEEFGQSIVAMRDGAVGRAKKAGLV